MPNYIKQYDGGSRLRSSHLDELSFVSSILPKSSSTNLLNKSFFYRTHSLWNNLPLELRALESKTQFRSPKLGPGWKPIFGSHCRITRGWSILICLTPDNNFNLAVNLAV